METMKLTVFVICLTGMCCSANVIDRIDDAYNDINDDIRYQNEKSWVQEHMWVPIVGSIVFVVLVVALCTCCCCGCCACCRSRPATVVYSGQPGGTQVTMASNTTVVQNPHHVGYNQ